MPIEKLSPDHFLIKTLANSYLDDWQRSQGQRDHLKRGYFYMSDVGACDRDTYYDFKCPEKKRPITIKTLMMFSGGNLVHDDLQTRARKTGLAESARDIEYGLSDWATKATGRLDFIIATYRFVEAEGGIAVAELKTKSPYAFGEEEPNQDEIDQMLWYIDRLKDAESKGVRQSRVLDYGFILYADRAGIADPLPLCGWRVDYDADRVAAIKARFTALDKAIRENVVPKRPFERDSVKCSYCRYRDFCWEGVPLPEAPIFLPDETVQKPEMELVESAAANYIRLKGEEKRIEAEMDEARDLLLRYFKATGTERIPVNGSAIVHEFSKRSSLDEDYLRRELPADILLRVCSPDSGLLKQAIKDGLVDGEILERAKKTMFSDSIKIKKGKGENNANV